MSVKQVSLDLDDVDDLVGTYACEDFIELQGMDYRIQIKVHHVPELIEELKRLHAEAMRISDEQNREISRVLDESNKVLEDMPWRV